MSRGLAGGPRLPYPWLGVCRHSCRGLHLLHFSSLLRNSLLWVQHLHTVEVPQNSYTGAHYHQQQQDDRRYIRPCLFGFLKSSLAPSR